MRKFKEGDLVVITSSGYGTSPKDKGLICRIHKIYEKGKSPAKFASYTVKIDRDKDGNNDRYLDPAALRHATPEEGGTAVVINNYQIY